MPGFIKVEKVTSREEQNMENNQKYLYLINIDKIVSITPLNMSDRQSEVPECYINTEEAEYHAVGTLPYFADEIAKQSNNFIVDATGFIWC